eukprot:scaffold3767_cov114-Isochrysis_galbana.AAC.14
MEEWCKKSSDQLFQLDSLVNKGSGHILQGAHLATVPQSYIRTTAYIQRSICTTRPGAVSQPLSQAFIQSTPSRQSGMVQPVIQEMFATVHAAGSSLLGLFTSCTTFDSTAPC